MRSCRAGEFRLTGARSAHPTRSAVWTECPDHGDDKRSPWLSYGGGNRRTCSVDDRRCLRRRRDREGDQRDDLDDLQADVPIVRVGARQFLARQHAIGAA